MRTHSCPSPVSNVHKTVVRATGADGSADITALVERHVREMFCLAVLLPRDVLVANALRKARLDRLHALVDRPERLVLHAIKAAQLPDDELAVGMQQHPLGAQPERALQRE